MRDAGTYSERAAAALRAVAEGNAAERDAQLDAMDVDDLRALVIHTQTLAVAARRVWLTKTTRLSDG